MEKKKHHKTNKTKQNKINANYFGHILFPFSACFFLFFEFKPIPTEFLEPFSPGLMAETERNQGGSGRVIFNVIFTGVVIVSSLAFAAGAVYSFDPKASFVFFYGTHSPEGQAHLCRPWAMMDNKTSAFIQSSFWFAACIFLLTFVFHCDPIFRSSPIDSVQKKYVSMMGSCISLFTLLTYLFLLVDEMDICNEHGLPVQFMRFVLWVVSTPVLIFLISLLAGRMNAKMLFIAMATDCLMIILGFRSRLFVDDFLFNYILACFCYVVVMWAMYNLFEEARCCSVLANDQKMIVLLRNLTFLVWLLFPVAELARSLLWVDVLISESLFTLADLSAKCAYSYVLVRGNFFVLDELSSARDIFQEEVMTDLQRSRNSMLLAHQIFKLAKEDQAQDENLHRSLVAKMSHELRTPLNSVIGYNELLLDAVESDKKDLVYNSLSSAKALLHVIDQILLRSNMQVTPEDNHLSLESTKFVLSDLLDEVAEILNPKAKENGVCLIMQVDPLILQATFSGDMYQLRLVFLNLLDNSIKFSKRDRDRAFALLRVRSLSPPIEGRPCSLSFEISDNGMGFLDGLGRDKKLTLASSNSRSGLGITRSTLEILGSDLSCYSSPGVGAWMKFSISFSSVEGLPANVTENKLSREVDFLVFTLIPELAPVVEQHVKGSGFTSVSSVVCATERIWEERFMGIAEAYLKSDKVVVLVAELSALERYVFSPELQVLFTHSNLEVFILSDLPEGHQRRVRVEECLGRRGALFVPRSFKSSSFLEVLGMSRNRIRQVLRNVKSFTSSEDEVVTALLVEDNEMNIKVLFLFFIFLTI